MRALSKFLDNLLQWIRYLIVVILALLVILKAMLMCGQMHIGIFPYVLFPKDVWSLLISIFAAHLQHTHANGLFITVCISRRLNACVVKSRMFSSSGRTLTSHPSMLTNTSFIVEGSLHELLFHALKVRIFYK